MCTPYFYKFLCYVNLYAVNTLAKSSVEARLRTGPVTKVDKLGSADFPRQKTGKDGFIRLFWEV